MADPVIWVTPNKRSMTVCSAMHRGTGFEMKMAWDFPTHDPAPPSIVYGIIRGCGEIIKRCQTEKQDVWHIDNGYFSAGHYDGYYRITKNGLQAKFDPSYIAPVKRWDALGLPISPWREGGKDLLFCPPSPNLSAFLGMAADDWLERVTIMARAKGWTPVVRYKGDPEPLERALDRTWRVVTHSSSVALEALRLGIPSFAYAGPVEGFCGSSWQRPDLQNRELLFRQLALRQFTLDEMASGEAWSAVR